RNAPRYIARDFAGAAPIRILLKDIGLILDEAVELGIELPLGRLVQQRLIEARNAGLGDEDIAALIKLWPAGTSLSARRDDLDLDAVVGGEGRHADGRPGRWLGGEVLAIDAVHRPELAEILEVGGGLER